MIDWILPIRPLRISSTALRVLGCERCCSPVWNTRLYLRDRLDHHPPLADRMRERLLAVDVLTGLAGVNAGEVVPVLGRGVDDHVHVLAIEQLAVVLIGRALVVLPHASARRMLRSATATIRAYVGGFP